MVHTLNTKESEETRGVSFLENAFIKNFLIGSILLLIAGWGILFYFIRPRETPLILHYNVYFLSLIHI